MPSVCEDDRACRDKVPVELVVFHGGVWDAEWNRVLPSEALLDDRIHVRQVATVWVVRQPVRTNDGFEFCLCLGHDFWVERHGEEERLKRRNCLSGSTVRREVRLFD